MDSPTLHLFRGTLRHTIDESRRLHDAFPTVPGLGECDRAVARRSRPQRVTSLDEPREVLLLDFWSGADGMQRLTNYL